MKHRIRAVDENNLQTGENYDINWLVETLGLNEVLLDPPPVRPSRNRTSAPESRSAAKTEPSRAVHPPVEPLSEKEAVKAVSQNLHWFENPERTIKAMEDAGSTLPDDVYDLSEGLLTDRDYGMLMPFVAIAYFCLVPTGPSPQLDFFRMSGQLDDLLEMTAKHMNRAELHNLIQGNCLQVHAFRVIANFMMSCFAKAPKNERPSADARISMLLLLKVITNEIAQAQLETL
jgi:hypothetical protein